MLQDEGGDLAAVGVTVGVDFFCYFYLHVIYWSMSHVFNYIKHSRARILKSRGFHCQCLDSKENQLCCALFLQFEVPF